MSTTSSLPLSSWSDDLKQISTSLQQTSKQIQTEFKEYAQDSEVKAKSNENVIPLHPEADPINILKRISALEATIETLKSDCEDYVRIRPKLAQEVTELLVENFLTIEELTLLTKGKNAKLDSNLQQLAINANRQNILWKRHNSTLPNTNNDASDKYCSHTVGESSKSINDENDGISYSEESFAESSSSCPPKEVDNLKRNSASFLSISSDGYGSIHITREEFDEIPMRKRGRCKLSHLQKIALFIYEETVERYQNGYRGKHLKITRETCLKYCGSFPGMSGVIRNSSLWRDVVSSLEHLGFIHMDPSDGTIKLTGI